MGSLLTLLAGALPSNCPTKELAVLVLFPVSAWRVVVGGGIGPLGVAVCEPPQRREGWRIEAVKPDSGNAGKNLCSQDTPGIEMLRSDIPSSVARGTCWTLGCLAEDFGYVGLSCRPDFWSTKNKPTPVHPFEVVTVVDLRILTYSSTRHRRVDRLFGCDSDAGIPSVAIVGGLGIESGDKSFQRVSDHHSRYKFHALVAKLAGHA